ncbi:hypothetical protein Y032_0437g1461 [Ancylostoma ceylanicum]|uniref:Uncharacterized protein n=1 Tax=Ancylostoma ceylanicum TaxID=53326 RepID=A0A016X1N1_9BILA|nr:hypothetical protein Y032_0437g1461 [Ancylostoma ceylanicum]
MNKPHSQAVRDALQYTATPPADGDDVDVQEMMDAEASFYERIPEPNLESELDSGEAMRSCKHSGCSRINIDTSIHICI